MQKSYAYTGINRYKKRVKGEFSANSLFEAKAELRGQKITKLVVREIRQAKAQKSRRNQKSLSDIQITFGPFGKISSKERLLFTKKLATMIKSGLALLDSLRLAESQIKNTVFKAVVKKIIDSVNSGMPLSKALALYPEHFDSLYVNMIEAGELTGKLDQFLERIVQSLEKMETIKSGVKGALFYPITLILISILVTYFMLVKIVPIFVTMYANVGAKLPAPTQFLVDASDVLTNGSNVLIVFGLIVTLYTAHTQLWKHSYGYKKSIDQLTLRIPLFGDLIIKSIVARISLIMANLFAAGIGINEIIRMAANSSNNLVLSEAQLRIAERAETGAELSGLFAGEEIFPIELSQLIKVGEQTGQMEDMLASIAKYYQEEFEVVVNGLTKVIEPLMIVFVGALIGLLILALYMPLFNIGDAIKG